MEIIYRTEASVGRLPVEECNQDSRTLVDIKRELTGARISPIQRRAGVVEDFQRADAKIDLDPSRL